VSNRNYRRAYFAKKKTKNNNQFVNDDYQNDHNVDTKNASKIFIKTREYHDEKHIEIQKNNENYVTQKSFEYFVNIFEKQIKIHICRRCQTKFYFNNKFHRHLRLCKIMSTKIDTSLTKKNSKLSNFYNTIECQNKYSI
jgi:hypothetical protein